MGFHSRTISFYMLRSPQVFSNKATLAVMLAVQGLCLPMGSRANAQVLPAQLPDSAPLGLRGISLPGATTQFGPAEGLKGVFAYGFGVQSSYYTNFFLDESNPESELAINVVPWITYSSDPEGGAPFSFTATYQPNIKTYVNNPDFDGVDNSGSINMRIEGSKTLITAYTNYNTVSGTDRFSGTFVTASLLGSGIRCTYQVAPRTSIFTNWTFAKTDYGSEQLVGSEIYNTEIGGFWSATERFSLGPAISYSREESTNTGTRDAWALSMQAQYLMATKFQFRGSLGFQYSTNSRDSGSATLGLTGDLAAVYAINENLHWTNSVHYQTVPSSSDVNYVINNLAVTTSLTRQLLRASVSLGLEINISDYAEVGTVGTQLNQENNLSTVLSYRRKLFLDRVDFDSSIRYTMNDGNRNWNQLQIAAGITIPF